MIIVFCFFCFKQKTAYEMRISDWSSDVCSSDLGRVPAGSSIRHHLLDVLLRLSSSAAAGWRFEAARCGRKAQNGGKPSPGGLVGVAPPRLCSGRVSPGSEEQTSELQSIMRLSYGVFCVKKQKSYDLNKKTKNITTYSTVSKK